MVKLLRASHDTCVVRRLATTKRRFRPELPVPGSRSDPNLLDSLCCLFFPLDTRNASCRLLAESKEFPRPNMTGDVWFHCNSLVPLWSKWMRFRDPRFCFHKWNRFWLSLLPKDKAVHSCNPTRCRDLQFHMECPTNWETRRRLQAL